MKKERSEISNAVDSLLAPVQHTENKWILEREEVR